MSYDIEDNEVEVDLSQLIDFSLTFQPLQLALQSITKRLGALEKENKQKSEEIDALNGALEELKKQQGGTKNKKKPSAQEKEHTEATNPLSWREEQRDIHTNDGESVNSSDEHDALWAEIGRLRDLLGEVTDLKNGRHSIEDIFRARKDHGISVETGALDSVVESEPTITRASTGVVLSGSSVGDRILSNARQLLEGLPGIPQGESQHSMHIIRVSTEPSMLQDEAGEAMEPRRKSLSTGHSQANLKPTFTIVEKIGKDGDDIAHLNRVVAEIISEMQGIHEDVNLLRTVADSSIIANGLVSPLPKGGEGNTDRDSNKAAHQLFDLMKRLRAVENHVGEVHSASTNRDGKLQSQIDDLKQSLKVASCLTEDDVGNLSNVPDLADRIKKLEDRINAAELANALTEEKLRSVLKLDQLDDSTGINPAQFALVAGTVEALQKQLQELQGLGNYKDWSSEVAQLTSKLQRVQENANRLEKTVDLTDKECRRLDEVKADRSNLASVVNPTDVDSAKGVHWDNSDNKLNELLDRVNRLEESTEESTALQRLRDELANLKRLMQLSTERDSVRLNIEPSFSASANNAATEELLRELERQLLTQQEANHTERESAREDLEGLRELIDQLDRRKADATLVANKAERDYVENALERLMREVEQVLNATNAGLIDTLDKSLNILRDMIDGKASKSDISRLQQAIVEEGGGGAAADGLTGFKGYRCLGCNRAMDSMRPRNTAPKMDAFLNRNAPNHPEDNVTRSIQQQQQAMQSRLLQQQQQQLRSTETASTHSEPLPRLDNRLL